MACAASRQRGIASSASTKNIRGWVLRLFYLQGAKCLSPLWRPTPQLAQRTLIGNIPGGVAKVKESVVLGIGVRIAWSAISSLTVGEGNYHSVSGQDDRPLLLLIGISVGFFSGLLANEGGFLQVPAFILLLGLSMHKAAGTSLVCIAGFAIPGTITHWLLGHIDPILMISLGVAVIPASYVGARVALRLKGSQV